MTGAMTGSAWTRVVLALVVAALGIFALDRLVRREAAGSKAISLAAVPPREPFESVSPVLPPMGRTRSILFLSGREPVPEGISQVVEIGPGGDVRLRRPPPLATTPAPPPTRAAVLRLPVSELAALSPAQRAAVLDALSALAGGVPLDPERVRGKGVSWKPGEMRALLRWQR